MNDGRRRGVTRSYVVGLIFAAAVSATAVLVAVWGLMVYFSGNEPVSTPGIPAPVAPLLVFIALVLLVWGLWQQSLELLRGIRLPTWGHMVLVGVGGYLIWCLGGLTLGLSVGDTWLSLYALSLAVIWFLTSLSYWAVLARRLYTDRPPPQWPWEKK